MQVAAVPFFHHQERHHSPLDPLPILIRCFLALSLLLCAIPPCSCVGSRQQHNVWYNGLQITDIAVDEASGDVFFSDAAGNRVVRQAANGSLLAVYESSFYSPMQLVYSEGKLYIADSHNNRVGIISVQSGQVSFSSPSPRLSSCSALALNSGSTNLYVVDGLGLSVQVFSPTSGAWLRWVDVSRARPRPNYLASATMEPHHQDDGQVWISDPTQPRMCWIYGYGARTGFDAPQPGVTAVQYYKSAPSSVQLYLLGQSAADQPMQITLTDDHGVLVSNWTAWGRGGKDTPFIGWAMYVDGGRNMYISDHGTDEQSRYGRIVKLAPNGSELAQWSMSDGIAYSFSSVWYDSNATTADGLSCAYWMADSEQGVVRMAANGDVLLPFYAAPVDQADGLTARFTGGRG